MGKPIRSMTGFSSVEGAVAGSRVRVEIKSLNHRFLDAKVRMPRELSAAEMPLRAALQSQFSRGSVELKVERLVDSDALIPQSQVNLTVAAHYFESLLKIQKALGLNDPIRTIDIANLPDVLARGSSELAVEEAWASLEPLATQAIQRLSEMREIEGKALNRVLLEALGDMESKLHLLRSRRAENEANYRSKIRTKITAIFDAHPMAETSIQGVLEGRIAQELSLLIDRTDIEEELIRFKGHLDHFRKVLTEGGPVGRKLDFILQELSREINTLGNKAQDLQISEESVQLKVRLEQVREQVMNIE